MKDQVVSNTSELSERVLADKPIEAAADSPVKSKVEQLIITDEVVHSAGHLFNGGDVSVVEKKE